MKEQICMTGLDKFKAVYGEELRRLHAEGVYNWARDTVETIEAKMCAEFDRCARDGSITFIKDGAAIQATCKRLGIKNTYRDIKAYLQAEVAQ